MGEVSVRYIVSDVGRVVRFYTGMLASTSTCSRHRASHAFPGEIVSSCSTSLAMPWMVVMFGIFVVPLGIVSIVLVMLQPIGVGAWCALCLIAAGRC